MSVACFGLILSGCDSGGSSTDDSNASSQTFEVTLEAVDTPGEGLIKSGVYEFTVTIENVSDETNTVLTSESADGTRPVATSPGVFAAHIDQNPMSEDDVTFFSAEGTAAGEHPLDGLADIAEDANVSVRSDAMGPITGVLVLFSPAAYATHGSNVSFHNVGGSASDDIKAIAADGNPGMHQSALSETDGVTSAVGSGPTPPGGFLFVRTLPLHVVGSRDWTRARL